MRSSQPAHLATDGLRVEAHPTLHLAARLPSLDAVAFESDLHADALERRARQLVEVYGCADGALRPAEIEMIRNALERERRQIRPEA